MAQVRSSPKTTRVIPKNMRRRSSPFAKFPKQLAIYRSQPLRQVSQRGNVNCKKPLDPSNQEPQLH